jgi:hypothetical protein
VRLKQPTLFPIVQTGVMCPSCLDEIFSNSVHDFTECRCGDTFVDGGFDYLRYGGRTLEDIRTVTRDVAVAPPR